MNILPSQSARKTIVQFVLLTVLCIGPWIIFETFNSSFDNGIVDVFFAPIIFLLFVRRPLSIGEVMQLCLELITLGTYLVGLFTILRRYQKNSIAQPFPGTTNTSTATLQPTKHRVVLIMAITALAPLFYVWFNKMHDLTSHQNSMFWAWLFSPLALVPGIIIASTVTSLRWSLKRIIRFLVGTFLLITVLGLIGGYFGF